MNKEEIKVVPLQCVVCGVHYTGQEPRRCCDGFQCGCNGQPIDPEVCSETCYDRLINKSWPESEPI